MAARRTAWCSSAMGIVSRLVCELGITRSNFGNWPSMRRDTSVTLSVANITWLASRRTLTGSSLSAERARISSVMARPGMITVRSPLASLTSHERSASRWVSVAAMRSLLPVKRERCR